MRGAAGVALCDSSRASFSSSMDLDLSPVKKQLFRSVSHSCHSLLQNAAGLSSIAAQLDTAAGVAAGHGSKEAVQAGRQALMAKQQRAELHQRVQQQQGGLSQQLAAGSQQRQGGLASGAPVTLDGRRVSVAARKVLSSSAETASSWAASSITPYINEAKAEAEAALAAADAAAQLSTSCPAALTMQAYRLRDSQSLPATTTATASASSAGQAATVAAAVVKEASAAVAAAAQKQGVLLGLSPVVPGGLDRASSAAQPAARSPSASDPNTSPRPELDQRAEAVAKALFPAAGAGASAGLPAGRAAVKGDLRHHHTESVGSATPAAAGAPGHLMLQDWPGPQGHTSHPAAAAGAASAPASPAGAQAGARAAAQSLPASPVPARADVQRASGAASLPASPAPVAPAVAAAAAAAAANVLLPSSRGSLGPRSTAALAELQTQLLTMAVEKAALQRQLQQGRSRIEMLHEKVGAGLAVRALHVQQAVHSQLGLALLHLLSNLCCWVLCACRAWLVCVFVFVTLMCLPIAAPTSCAVGLQGRAAGAGGAADAQRPTAGHTHAGAHRRRCARAGHTQPAAAGADAAGEQPACLSRCW